ncbi:MAG: ABC transporter ATP-binding protein [Bryobacterales bacterium]|nr:ABC transporter ATP-binding protein [Bryobacterales bacterium]
MEEEQLGRFYDGKLLRRLLGYLKPYRSTVAVAVLCMLIHSTLQVAGPWLTKYAIDRYLAPAKPLTSWLDPLLSADPRSGLAQVALLYLAALALALLMEYSQAFLMNRTAQHAMWDLRRQTMAKLQQLDLAYYDRHPVGRLLTRVTTDGDALNEMFSSGVVALIGDLLMVFLTLIVLFQLSPSLGIVLVIPIPALLWVTMRFRRSVTKSNRRIRTAVARINSYLQEHVSGMSVLQLFNGEARSRQEFSDVNREHMDAYKEAIVAYGWFYPSVEFVSMVTLAGLLAWGGVQVRDQSLSLGVLVAFFQYGLRLFRPIQDLSEKYNILQTAAAAAERIFQLIDTPVTIQAPGDSKRPPASPATIEFDRVWFAYKNEDWVLRDVSFTIQPGETIAVVGHTGAGKTTLVNLLLRFYDVQKGTIRLGGVDIREYRPEQLRERFAIVLQDSFLFTGTLEDNVKLGTTGIETGRVLHALEQVNLGDFVRSLPDGVHHAVKERGAGLSVGQKQLISFARALAHDPMFLILDEATSSVDTATELRIREALERLVAGRTSVVIAHRLSTIQRATRIFVMHKGQLRETGTHQELLAQRGIYWKLYQLQYKEQELVQAAKE